MVVPSEGRPHNFISLGVSKDHNLTLIIAKRGYMKYLFHYLEFWTLPDYISNNSYIVL